MQFDIIIIGGGMVGAALARALRASSFKIALVDAAPAETSDDARLIALNHSSYILLNNLDIWKTLAPHAAAINQVHVSHRGHFGMSRLLASDLQLSALGYVVPAKYINQALYQHIENMTLIRPGILQDLIQYSDHVKIVINTPEGEKHITGKIVIGADGTHSTVRKLLQIPTKIHDYAQSALVTITELQRSHNNIAYERFQKKQGAIAMLPLIGNRVATIWSDTRENILALQKISTAEFLSRLQKQFGYRLGRFNSIHERFVYPLQSIQAEQKVKQRVILIGNAAHTLHPIAAQGLNLAFYEIAALCDYLTEHHIEKISLTDFATQQQKISLTLSHYLTRIFSEDFFADIFMIRAARQLGMIGLDMCQPLKKHFVKQAIGQTGRVPLLLRDH